MNPSETTAATIMDELRSIVEEVQSEAHGRLDILYGMQESVHAGRDVAVDPLNRVLLNAAFVVLSTAIARELRVQSPIAPVSTLVPFDGLARRISRLLPMLLDLTDRDEQKGDSVLDSLLEMEEELDLRDPIDQDSGLLLAAALLIVGAARHISES